MAGRVVELPEEALHKMSPSLFLPPFLRTPGLIPVPAHLLLILALSTHATVSAQGLAQGMEILSTNAQGPAAHKLHTRYAQGSAPQNTIACEL